MRCNATLPKFIKPFSSYLRSAGYYCTNNAKQDYQFKTPKGAWDASSKNAHWGNRDNTDMPFFAVFNFGGCHESGIASESKYRSVTANLPDEHRQDPAKLELPPYYPDTPVVREDWKRNYELITAMDAWVGDLIQELKDAGEYENTIIFFWSDHGVGLPRAKRWLYDSGTHIPLVIRIPKKFRKAGQGKEDTVDDQLISSIDFAPTVLNLADVELQEHFQGRAFLGSQLTPERDYIYGARDRMDERYDIIRSVRDKQFRYIRNYEPFKAYYQYMNTPEKGATMSELRRMAKDEDLPPAANLFMGQSKPAEEFYDLKADPHEINNLADAPKYADQIDRMRKAHLQWVTDTRDLGLMPESEIVRRETKAGSRYSILQNADGDLVSEIRTVANAACGDALNLPTLEKAVAHSDAVVRYWGAIGIGNLHEHANESAVALIERSLDDESPCVRIAAARALLKLNKPDAALATLKKELISDHQWARLRATIVLGEAGELARPLIADMQACLENQPNKYITRVANRTLNVLLGTNNEVR